MKTLKTILVTMLVTAMVIGGFVGNFLFNEGIVTFEERTKDHNKQVIVDGTVIENKTWTETLGVEIKIDVLDSAYFGK